MRKHFLFLFLSLFIVETSIAQTRGPKIGYIDMEYILENVTGYIEATNQLEVKSQNWKQEIETKKNEIKTLKDALTIEKVLLTRELIEERQTEINFLETELVDFQQKRFGPNGFYMAQKSSLSKPVQDQVFTIVQDIAEKQKFDFIFDKTSDFTMLFAAKRYDISDQVLRKLNNSDKREQLSKKQLEAQLVKEKIQEALDENPELNERKLELDAKKAAKDKLLQDRIQLQEQKRKEFEENRQKIKQEREAKRNGTVSATTEKNTGDPATAASSESKTTDAKVAALKTATDAEKEKVAAERALTIEAKKQEIANRKKELEDKRKKILEEREAQRKAKEEELKLKTKVN